MRLIKRTKLTKRQVKRFFEVILRIITIIGTILVFLMFIMRLIQIGTGNVPANPQRFCEDMTAVIICIITMILTIICEILHDHRT